jgi:hypothetical protein
MAYDIVQPEKEREREMPSPVDTLLAIEDIRSLNAR